MFIRKAIPEDLPGVCNLYREVARLSRGIARLEHEITDAWIRATYEQATQHGLMLVVVDPPTGGLMAELHASTYDIQIFSHILTSLTIVVKPACQGKGVGKELFRAFLTEVDDNWPHISRIELESRASNHKSIGLYRSLGVVEEGTLRNKTGNPNGTYEDSLLFARLRPGFAAR